MATQKNKRALLSTSFSGFDGINVFASHTGKASTKNMENWRIRRDGSLEKRWGFKQLYNFNKKIEAIWTGLIDGNFYVYVFTNGTVKCCDLTTGSLSTIGAPPSTDKTSPRFFYLNSKLYLATGGGIFEVKSNGLTSASGYVPLIGKDWQNDLVGEINQPMNILNRRGRFTYTVSESPSIFFRVLYPVDTIDSVKVNGASIDSSRYYFDSYFNTINISDLSAGDKVEIAVTFDIDLSPSLDKLLDTNATATFGGISNSRVFLWNNTGSPVVFSSAFVSNTDLAESRAAYPSSDGLYFPEGYEFTVGDGKNIIKGAQRHYDRLLFFTDGDVWMADSSACGYEDFPVMNINSGIGCPSDGAVTMAGNDPISVGNTKIYRWTADTDELNECNAYSISDELEGLLPESFFKNAKVFANRQDGEVWFHDPSEGNTVWIYQYESKKWFKYTGISADGFFDANGRVGFYKDGRLYAFDPECYTDIYESYEETITASFESGLVDFGTRQVKKLKSVEYTGDTCRSIRLMLYPTELGSQTFNTSLSGYGHGRFQKRLFSGRFENMTVKISTSDINRAIIHDLTLTAK